VPSASVVGMPAAAVLPAVWDGVQTPAPVGSWGWGEGRPVRYTQARDPPETILAQQGSPVPFQGT